MTGECYEKLLQIVFLVRNLDVGDLRVIIVDRSIYPYQRCIGISFLGNDWLSDVSISDDRISLDLAPVSGFHRSQNEAFHNPL
jgi:hypothetical protein